MSAFCIDEHIHRFGLWTAARAASQRLLSNDEVKTVAEQIGLREKVECLRKNTALSDAAYTEWLKKICEQLIVAVGELSCKNIKKDRIQYGIAVKIVAVYIKTVEVVPTRGASRLSAIAHPPVDSILLRRFNSVHGKKLDVRWSLFGWEAYLETIEALREEKKDKKWWEMEEYWEQVK